MPGHGGSLDRRKCLKILDTPSPTRSRPLLIVLSPYSDTKPASARKLFR
jgi:hypothetical protein